MLQHNISWLFSKYLTKQFLSSFLLVVAVFAALIFLIDNIELLRRASDKENVGFALILQMAFLKLPNIIQKLLLFAVLIGSLLCLSRLTKSSELVVARAAGISVWQFLLPAMGVSMLISIMVISVINPLSSSMMEKYEQLEAKYFGEITNSLTISGSGLWLKEQVKSSSRSSDKSQGQENQANNNDNSVNNNDINNKSAIIHAASFDRQQLELFEVIMFVFDRNHKFLGRVDAKKAKLMVNPKTLKNYWHLHDVYILSPTSSDYHDEYRIATTISAENVQESFAAPETISFWELPEFISNLEKAGFSARPHKMYYYQLLASPIIYGAMVWVAALFALRIARRGKVGWMIAAGIFTGFVIYFSSNIIYALGVSGHFPILVASFLPPFLCLIISGSLLLHYEDG